MMKFDIDKLYQAVGSPAYVFSEQIFTDRAEQVKEAFGENVNICFSIKANPFLLTVLPEVFSNVEVCSPGELAICAALGVDPAKIIFSGVNKQFHEIKAAMEYGAAVLTIESYSHLRDINECALEMGVVADVLIRVSAETQFGMDKRDVQSIISGRSEYPGINIVGIHFFTGTQKRKAKDILRETQDLRDFVAEVREKTGFEIERIEYGTGLAVDYFRADADESEAERLAEIAPAIRELGEVGQLTIEMGRFFAAPCGFYFTGVADTKLNDGSRFAILEGGLHQLKYDGQMQGMQIPVIEHLSMGAEPAEWERGEEGWTLCGSLCTTADVLARNVQFADLKQGDVLCFERIGAYSVTEGMANFLSRDLPAVFVLKSDGKLICLREHAETYPLNMPSYLTE